MGVPTTAEEQYNDLNTIVINEGGVLKVIDIHTGEVVAANNLRDISPTQKYVYSVPLASHICDLLREGKSFVDISKQANMPPYTAIMRWRYQHPDFAEAIKRAKKDRAELYHDKVLELAESIGDEDDAKVVKPKIDAYKWAAEKNNPEEYGKARPEVGNTGITFVIKTGLPDDTPLTIEAEYDNITEEGEEQRGTDILCED